MRKEKGVILYLAIVVMMIMLAMVLGLGSIFIGQLKILRGVGHSVIALYAAEAGMEQILYDDKTVPGSIVMNCVNPGDCTGVLPNGATYDVTVKDFTVPSCLAAGATTYCIEASGAFKNSTRKISIVR